MIPAELIKNRWMEICEKNIRRKHTISSVALVTELVRWAEEYLSAELLKDTGTYTKTNAPDKDYEIAVKERDYYRFGFYQLSEERCWIPCSEKFPEECKEIVIIAKPEISSVQTCHVAIYKDGSFHTYRHNLPIEMVTHWMPLPEPPEVK